MSRGPYYSVLPRYTLSFSDAGGFFTVEAHLDYMGEGKAKVLGLDVENTNLEILFANPKAGSPRIRHDMTASITPSFDGLEGTVMIKGRPRSDYIPQTNAEGLTIYGEFSEAATSATSSWLPWVRTRRIRIGLQLDTKAPIYSTDQETVMLEQLTERGDLTGDFTGTGANVLAVAQTLKTGDILTREGESFVVINVLPQGQYERAELSLRSY